MGTTSPMLSLYTDGPSPSITLRDSIEKTTHHDAGPIQLSGMAIMSTNPKDYPIVRRLANELSMTSIKQNDYNSNLHAIPCFGVHPWWVHELSDDDWTTMNTNGSKNIPKWVGDLEDVLIETPHSIVGETGLDGFHFNAITKELSCSMEKQVLAFEYQLLLAYQLHRSVSIHTVQCFGPLLTVLSKFQKLNQLPPKLYFHAYGGKVGTVDQILSICEGKNHKNKQPKTATTITSSSSSTSQLQQQKEQRRVYFGFAPVVNFRSPKTALVVQHIGIDRIVLETDHEDSICVQPSIREGIEFLSTIFNMKEQDIIDITTKNAYELYGITE